MEKKDIYLIGSFFNFRDKIIKALPQFNFADPRLHRQSSMAKLVTDDLNEAQHCPVSLVVFPRGKTRGIMSYTEIGVAYAHNNFLIIVDENEEKDINLQKLSNLTFNDLDDALKSLQNFNLPSIKTNKIISKYPSGFSGVVSFKNIIFTGEYDDKLKKSIKICEKRRPDLNIKFATNFYQEMNKIAHNDCLITYFPKGKDWNRGACMLMGSAYAHDITTFIVDEHQPPHPPLQAVARRQGTLENAIDYILKVDDLHINKESLVMYDLLKV
jgi:hypothetical protein